MPMTYKATLTVDFTGSKNKEQKGRESAGYTKLSVALVELGWRHLETSAFVIESRPLKDVWTGIEIVMKQAANAGALSALTLTIQGSADWAGVSEKSTLNPARALSTILQLKLPREL